MAATQDRPVGFWEYVKQPWLRRVFARVLPGSGGRQPPDDRQIRDAIRGFLTREPSHRKLAWLRSAGPALLPSLLDALRNPTIRDAAKHSDHALADTPLETVLDLLEPFASLEAIAPLTDLALDQTNDRRKDPALALGSIGALPCIEPLARVLADPDEYVRCYALMGIQRAALDGRATVEFRSAAFDLVLKALDDNEFNPAEQAPTCLLDLDRPRAVGVLTGPDRFHRENANLLEQLRALNAARVGDLPAASVRAVMASVQADASQYPWEGVYSELLKLLARSAGRDAISDCRRAVEWGNNTVRKGAAGALAIAVGIGDPHDYVFRRLEQVGEACLTKAQRAYFVLSTLDAEVRNGGFHQYYVNSSGDNATDAPELARLVGAPKTAEVIASASALFGTGGPPRNGKKRHSRLAAFTPTQDEELRRLDEEYYGQSEKLEAILPFYAAERADEFRDPD